MSNEAKMNSALILVDYINEIVHPDGKLAKKGYAKYVAEVGVDRNVRDLLAIARNQGVVIVHVRVGFSSGYAEHPTKSPLFGAAREFRALEQGGWGFEFVEFAVPAADESQITKNRVSAFYGTNLDLILRANQIEDIYLAGCATDLAVEAAARDAHDRDYNVYVVKDACAAASIEDHQRSIVTIEKVAKIVTVSDLSK